MKGSQGSPTLHRTDPRGGQGHTQVGGYSHSGRPRFIGRPEPARTAHTAFRASSADVVSSRTCPTSLWGLFHHPHTCSSPLHPWASLPPPPVTSPCPFSPFPSYCEVRIRAYDTSVCCHGNRGGLRLERRSSDQAPSATWRSHLSWLPQGQGRQPQARWLTGRSTRARDEGVPAGRRSPPGPGR